MTFVVLVILAVVWALYLASYLRSRAQGRRSSNSIASFNKHLSVLERARPVGVDNPSLRPAPAASRAGAAGGPMPVIGGRNPAVALANLAPAGVAPAGRPMTLREAQKRRRDVLAGLAGFAVFTLAIFLLVGGVTLYLHLLADFLLVAYAGALAYIQHLARERREKVHYLHQGEEHHPEPSFALQRSAN